MNEIINSVNLFFIWNINSSIKTSILIIFILLTRAVFKYSIGIKFQYIIWFLVVLRLLVPSSLESRLSINSFIPAIGYSSSVNRNNNNIIFSRSNAEKKENDEVSIILNTEYEAGYDNSKHVLYNCPMPLFLLWLTGMLLSLCSAILQNYRFNKILRKEANVQDKKIINLFEKCKRKMYVNKRIPLIISEEVKVPTLYGIITPKLLLPQNILKALTLDDMHFIFIHELSHFKRKDILIYWLLTILTALHWFNPFIRYAFHKMREDCELCCDSLVLSHVGPEKLMEYGHTIIKLAENISKEHQLIVNTFASKNKSQLKRRITMINLYKKCSCRLSLLAIALLVIISFLSFTSASSKTIRHVKGETLISSPIDKPSRKNIIIYNTHCFETYSNGDSVTDAAKALENKLTSLGLESTYLEMPKDIDIKKAYSISRKLVTDSAKNYSECILIDLHRGIAPLSENNEKNLVRVVLGKNNPKFIQNSKFANSLLEELKKAGVIKTDMFISRPSTYNQDLSTNAVLLEIGNTDSSKQDIENCIDALGEALKKIF